MILMWIATFLSFGLGLAADNIRIMFGTFAGSLFACAVACLPEWRLFNRSPLKFRQSTSVSVE